MLLRTSFPAGRLSGLAARQEERALASDPPEHPGDEHQPDQHGVARTSRLELPWNVAREQCDL